MATPVLAQENSEVANLQPSGNWVLDYADTRCRIVRTFERETGGDTTLLFFEQYEPSNAYSWLLAGEAVPNRSTVSVRFGPVNESFEQSGRIIEFGDYDRVIRGHGFRSSENIIITGSEKRGRTARKSTPVTPAVEKQPATPPIGDVEWLDIEAGTSRAVRIPLAEMEQVSAAMDDCMDNLVAHWGIHLEDHDRVAERAKMTNVADIARRVFRDYPSAALRQGRQAEIMLRLIIEEDGSASQCVRTDLTEAEMFDVGLCRLVMKRGEFEPARDSEGKPVRHYLIQRIRYVIS